MSTWPNIQWLALVLALLAVCAVGFAAMVLRSPEGTEPPSQLDDMDQQRAGGVR